ncbi:myb-like protein X [Polypterus senegalus]|uniref:myb-like protein X n=1 Tax=Polypterus senegalus TaxID=55291 RepID=UPI0019625FF5|nr:myb-like protein X [Polypterus senegalus]
MRYEKIEKKPQDKDSEDRETKQQQDSEVPSQPASHSGLTNQMNPATKSEQNGQGQSTGSENDTAGERSKSLSDTTLYVQNNTSEQPSNDLKVQTNAEEFQKADKETKQKDDDVPHLKNSPETEVKECNDLFKSAHNLIDKLLQRTKSAKEPEEPGFSGEFPRILYISVQRSV